MGEVYSIPKSCKIVCTSFKEEGATAISKPPLVCGSGNNNLASVSSTPGPKTTPALTELQLRAVAPGIVF